MHRKLISFFLPMVGGIVAFSAALIIQQPPVDGLQVLQVAILCICAIALVARTSAALRKDYAETTCPRVPQVVVVGTKPHVDRYIESVGKKMNRLGCVTAILTINPDKSFSFDGQPIPARYRSIDDVLNSHVVDEVLALGTVDFSYLSDIANSCIRRGVTFRTLISLTEQSCRYRVEPVPELGCVLSLERKPRSRIALSIKRLLDIVGSLVGLVLAGIAYLWYAPKIKRDSPGPVIFRQVRVGLHGRRFTLYKFRTMYQDAEARLKDLMRLNEMKGHVFKLSNDPRITPIGRHLRRFHIDELPQFLNVLRGEMSLVGTRPPTPNEVANYLPHHWRRLSMKPGITGLWQLEGNGKVSDFEEIVRLDCEYIDNWSLWLDCKILLKTVSKVFKGDGW